MAFYHLQTTWLLEVEPNCDFVWKAWKSMFCYFLVGLEILFVLFLQIKFHGCEGVSWSFYSSKQMMQKEKMEGIFCRSHTFVNTNIMLIRFSFNSPLIISKMVFCFNGILTFITQSAFTCLKLTKETLEQGVKYVQS